MKLRFFLSSIFLAGLSMCSNKTSHKEAIENGSSANATCFNYSFGKQFPYIFNVSKDFIYVGNGSAIFKFEKTGKFASKIILPKELSSKAAFLDFLPIGIDTNESYLITILENLYEIDGFNHRKIVSEFGEKIRSGMSNSLITLFQGYDSIRNQTLNGIKILNYGSREVLNYPIKDDMGAINIEFIDNNIGLYANNKFYLLPFDTTKTPNSKNLDISSEGSGLVWFLGMQGDFYTFRTYSHKEKKDHLHFYDRDLRFIAEGIVDLSFDELSENIKVDTDFRMDYPSGNIYHFDNKSKTIFLLRNGKDKVCVFSVLDNLRIIKGQL